MIDNVAFGKDGNSNVIMPLQVPNSPHDNLHSVPSLHARPKLVSPHLDIFLDSIVKRKVESRVQGRKGQIQFSPGEARSTACQPPLHNTLPSAKGVGILTACRDNFVCPSRTAGNTFPVASSLRDRASAQA